MIHLYMKPRSLSSHPSDPGLRIRDITPDSDAERSMHTNSHNLTSGLLQVEIEADVSQHHAQTGVQDNVYTGRPVVSCVCA
jgi:hypothetical protein